MNPDLHDDTWMSCGTSLLWDAEALNRICAAESVRSLREFLRLHQAGWPEEKLNLVNNRTLVIAGLEATMDTLEPDEAVEWFERLGEAAELDFLAIRISYAGANRRRIELRATGSRHAPLVEKLKRRFA